VLTGIVNPTKTGNTGTFTITTKDASDVDIDTLSGVAAISITGTLSKPTTAHANLAAGGTGTITIGFTSASDIPSDGILKVTFPSGYDVSGSLSITPGSSRTQLSPEKGERRSSK
jgi:hypothetical protein